MSVEQAGNTIRDLHLVIGGETLDFKHSALIFGLAHNTFRRDEQNILFLLEKTDFVIKIQDIIDFFLFYKIPGNTGISL